MPTLDNPRHERFAQELAKGNSASEAYVAAGYNESRSAASRLSTNVNIVARVAELQAAMAEKAIIDATWVLEKLVENANRAMQCAEGNVANRALELIGKHVAVQAFREQVAHVGKEGGPVQIEKVSAREIFESRIAQLAARAAQDSSAAKPH